MWCVVYDDMYDVTRTPEVMTTDWKRSKTGLMAMEASMQLKFITGLAMVGARSSNGSTRNVKPAAHSCRRPHSRAPVCEQCEC